MQELEKILEEIEKLRMTYSFQSERGQHLSRNNNMIIDAVEKIIRKHMNDGWISVEDRLPKRTLDEKMNKSYKKYLVFIDSVDGWDIDIAVYDFWNDKKWCEAHDGYGEIENVIAWRSLPEPYRPEKSVGE